jgi:hypothetical protein
MTGNEQQRDRHILLFIFVANHSVMLEPYVFLILCKLASASYELHHKLKREGNMDRDVRFKISYFQ